MTVLDGSIGRDCSCYVQFLSAETRFGLHYGAHNPACRAYRQSLDSVDRANDNEYRQANEQRVVARMVAHGRDGMPID